MFETIIGHEKIKNLLEKQIEQSSFSHAYLFSGPEGIGKKKLALEFLKEILLTGLRTERSKIPEEHADLFIFGEEGKKMGIEQVRNLISETTVTPYSGKYRVFLIDNADLLNPIAQNALLKTIEEPAPANIFALVTANPNGLLDTIKSRCQQLSLHDLSEQDKKEILEREGIDLSLADLSLTPGENVLNLQTKGKTNNLDSIYQRFMDIYNGNTFLAFDLAEEIGKDKSGAQDTVVYLIRKLYKKIKQENGSSSKSLKVISQLFELLDKLSYNVNSRLQLESSFIEISLEKE